MCHMGRGGREGLKPINWAGKGSREDLGVMPEGAVHGHKSLDAQKGSNRNHQHSTAQHAKAQHSIACLKIVQAAQVRLTSMLSSTQPGQLGTRGIP